MNRLYDDDTLDLLVRDGTAHVDGPSLADAEVCATLLFRVLAETDGDVAVLHAGDIPYMEGPTGEVDLTRHRLTPAAMAALASYFLPLPALRTLRAGGSVQLEWPVTEELPGDRFTIVAARRHDDLWIEVRHVKPQQQAGMAPAGPPAARARREHGEATLESEDDSLCVPSAKELWRRRTDASKRGARSHDLHG